MNEIPVKVSEDYISHAGRKGMKWYQHIFGKDNSSSKQSNPVTKTYKTVKNLEKERRKLNRDAAKALQKAKSYDKKPYPDWDESKSDELWYDYDDKWYKASKQNTRSKEFLTATDAITPITKEQKNNETLSEKRAKYAMMSTKLANYNFTDKYDEVSKLNKQLEPYEEKIKKALDEQADTLAKQNPAYDKNDMIGYEKLKSHYMNETNLRENIEKQLGDNYQSLLDRHREAVDNYHAACKSATDDLIGEYGNIKMKDMVPDTNLPNNMTYSDFIRDAIHDYTKMQYSKSS